MIRASDLAATSAPLSWAPAPLPSPRRAESANAAGWFDGWSPTEARATIRGELNPAARGLSADQHASRVLMHLRDGR
jgi:hypothetical protein